MISAMNYMRIHVYTTISPFHERGLVIQFLHIAMQWEVHLHPTFSSTHASVPLKIGLPFALYDEHFQHIFSVKSIVCDEK